MVIALIVVGGVAVVLGLCANRSTRTKEHRAREGRRSLILEQERTVRTGGK